MENGVEMAPLGLYVVRGDNVALVGDVDEELDQKLDLSGCSCERPRTHTMVKRSNKNKKQMLLALEAAEEVALLVSEYALAKIEFGAVVEKEVYQVVYKVNAYSAHGAVCEEPWLFSLVVSSPSSLSLSLSFSSRSGNGSARLVRRPPSLMTLTLILTLRDNTAGHHSSSEEIESRFQASQNATDNEEKEWQLKVASHRAPRDHR